MRASAARKTCSLSMRSMDAVQPCIAARRAEQKKDLTSFAQT
jgi:hypothetical protein